MSTTNTAGVNAYRKVAVQTGVNDASPHRLIQMLLEAVLEKIAKAKGFMANGKIADKGNNIAMAVSIIDALRASLDMQQGGEISKNLEGLYDYMTRRLTEANVSNNQEILDEVVSLILPIKEAWDAIPENVKQEHQSKQQIQDAQEVAAG